MAYTVALCGMVEFGLVWYGPEIVFASWNQIFRVPLDLFERMTLCGRQIASHLYFTSEADMSGEETQAHRSVEETVTASLG